MAYIVKPNLVYAGDVTSDARRASVCRNVARLLKAERVRQNLSLNALAAKAGLSRQMVSYIEQTERNPTLDSLLRICAALEVDLYDLLKRAQVDEKP